MKTRTKPGGGGGGGWGVREGEFPSRTNSKRRKLYVYKCIYARKVTKTDARFKDSKTLISILFLK